MFTTHLMAGIGDAETLCRIDCDAADRRGEVVVITTDEDRTDCAECRSEVKRRKDRSRRAFFAGGGWSGRRR